MLHVDEIDVLYGRSHVLHQVSLAVHVGQIVGVIGRNGVGKTTLLKALIGLVPCARGSIQLEGEDVTHLSPHLRSRRGMTYVPQGREIFPRLTVFENLKLGCLDDDEQFQEGIERVFGYFPFLRDRLQQKGGTLSGGEQQMLALGRGLVGQPRIMLLDEPTEGIQPSIVDEIGRKLKEINREMGLSILLVEQNLELVFQLSDWCYIIEKGQIAREGPVNQLRDAEIVRRHLAI